MKNRRRALDSMIAVIPIRKPDEKLNSIVSGLLELEGFSVIVAPEGNFEESFEAFSGLDERTYVMSCPSGGGTGAALKNAFGYIGSEDSFREDDGVVIVEADGRYSMEDVVLVTEKWRENTDSFVVGGIRLKGVPALRRFGEGITRTAFAVSTGVRIHDLYSGLRAFPVSMIGTMLEIGGSGKDYLNNQLMFLTKKHVRVIETVIGEIDYDRNSPHRASAADALRVYRTIFSFVGSGIISWVVDYTLLLVLHALFRMRVERTGEMFLIPDLDPKLPAVVIARIVSSTVNYFLNRRVVFRSGNKLSFLLYVVTVAVLLLLNYLLLDLMTRAGIPLWIAQIMAQIIIYPMSFFLQRKFVFRNKKS